MGRIMVSLLLTVCACVFSILNTEAKPQYGDWWANNRAPQYVDLFANNRGQYGNYGPMFRRQPPNYMNWWARPTPQFPQYGLQLPQYGPQLPQYGPQLPQYGPQFPQYGPQFPQYGNYGGLWGGLFEWGAAGSQSHAGPWSHILMGK